MHNKNKSVDEIWDVVVIGGGPAGMMAAGCAGSRKKKVILLEKNVDLGKKLLITGGGRCNLTNNKTDVREMLTNYKSGNQFLFSAFSQFSVKDTISFFNERGMKTKEENDGRIFPASNSSKSVYDILYKYMEEGNVNIRKNITVNGLEIDKNNNIVINTKNGNKFYAKSCILATGGISHPETGSTGEGFGWLKKLNHKIIENDVALVPIALNNSWVKKISGTTLNNIKLTVFQDNKRKQSVRGKLLFTHFGVSGPTILNMSKNIGQLLKNGKVDIVLDLFPDDDNKTLKQNLQNIMVLESNKKLKNVLGKFIPSSLVPVILELSSIDGETFCHSVSSENRIKIIKQIKEIPLNVKSLLGKNKAIISSGGVDLKEINFKTMQSRIVPNIFIVGDVLNIDRPSGGYSLQLCWTTGYVAGNNC